MFKKISLVMLIFVLASWSISSSPQEIQKPEKEVQVQEKAPPVTVQIRPDLLVSNMWISTEPGSGGMTLVRINYIVKNDSSAHSSCCPTPEGKEAWEEHPHQNLLYEISVEARSYPNGRFKRLSNGGMVGTWTGPHETQTYHATDRYESGKIKQYRVRLDPENWIYEKNEDNNVKMMVWPLIKYKKE